MECTMKYPLSVLVVDDVPEITDGMCRILGRVFETCRKASNGLEAIDLCTAHHVDVLITDVVMPEMNGVELVRQVRERFPHIRPLVVITGEASPESLETIEEMGIQTFTKPLDVDALLTFLESAFGAP
jgi:CheY-like chemotaxis protein